MYNLDDFKTEIIGISAEIAIANTFNIPVNQNYRDRGDSKIIGLLSPYIEDIFTKNRIPTPKILVAENQNDTDFILSDGRTLSVKSNKKDLGKVAPQIVGQPTSNTYFQHFSEFFSSQIPKDYQSRAKLFKDFTFYNINKVINKYWIYLFHCDYMIYFFNILDAKGNISKKPNFVVLEKIKAPTWDKDKFSFTQTLMTWNESNTLKYNNISIGEFQVHNNRDNFKFRFNMKNILKMIDEGVIYV